MKKYTKIISVLMIFVLCCTFFSGCSLFAPKAAYDLLDRSSQVIAKTNDNYKMTLTMDTTIESEENASLSTKFELLSMEKGVRGKIVTTLNKSVEDVAIKSENKSEFYETIDGESVLFYMNQGDVWTVSKRESRFVLSKMLTPTDAKADDLLKGIAVEKNKDGFAIKMKAADLMGLKTVSEMVEVGFENFELSVLQNVNVTLSFDKDYMLTGIHMDTIELSNEQSAEFAKRIGIDGNAKIKIDTSAKLDRYGKIYSTEVALPSKAKSDAVEVEENKINAAIILDETETKEEDQTEVPVVEEDVDDVDNIVSEEPVESEEEIDEMVTDSENTVSEDEKDISEQDVDVGQSDDENSIEDENSEVSIFDRNDTESSSVETSIFKESPESEESSEEQIEKSYLFELEGKQIEFGEITYTEFEKLIGYSIMDDEKSMILNPGEWQQINMRDKETKHVFSAIIENNTDESLQYKDCVIAQIAQDDIDISVCKVALKFAKDVIVGERAERDVLVEKFGEPDQEYNSDEEINEYTYTVYKWKEHSGEKPTSLELHVHYDSNIIKFICLGVESA